MSGRMTAYEFGLRVSLDGHWLTLELGQSMRVLSWAINQPGFAVAQHIVWREVCNADLPKDLNVRDWLDAELADRGETGSIAFLTSRNIARFRMSRAHVGEVHASVVATVGLSNAERIGHRSPPAETDSYGTINVAACLDQGLSEAGLIEALSVVVQARTAAVMDAGVCVPSGVATGTGTDCVAIAAPEGALDYAGLHTEIGEALGHAVYDAVHEGALEWKVEQEG